MFSRSKNPGIIDYLSQLQKKKAGGDSAYGELRFQSPNVMQFLKIDEKRKTRLGVRRASREERSS